MFGKCSIHFPKSEENTCANIAVALTLITQRSAIVSFPEKRADAELELFSIAMSFTNKQTKLAFQQLKPRKTIKEIELLSVN